MVGGRWRKVDGGRGRRGVLRAIAVVHGVVQVADVVGRRAADRTVLSRASRGSGAGSRRLLAGSLSFGIGVKIGGGVHADSSRLN